MHLLLLSISILLGVVGGLMILSPKAAGWLNKSGNVVVLSDKKVLEHRFLSGLISLGFGIFFLFKASGYDQPHTESLKLPFYSIGILLTLFGMMFFMSSKFFESINSLTSKEMVNDKILMKYPRITGGFLLISSVSVYYTSKYFAG
ncbi:MAG: hypothetical protein IIB39_10095 [Candidatus Marinimicrobia bacterium]|nr:hypothetical protein [Candidatus Neomarinimicrobiota bacterium]